MSGRYKKLLLINWFVKFWKIKMDEIKEKEKKS